jgi:putative ABC transport system ATP-binding protein
LEDQEPGGKAIELIDVSKIYRVDSKVVNALIEINIGISAGGFVAITGPSGAGKTTLLNIVGGLDKPTEGEVRVIGLTISDLEEDVLAAFRCRSIGYVFQSYNLVSTLTAVENIEFAMELAGSHGENIAEKAMVLLDTVGLKERANHLPGQLSGGEQQRVAFARALANDPPILLIDEPTANLDDSTATGIVGILRLLKEKAKTILVTTHDMRILQLADRCLKMSNGKIDS